MMPRPPRSPLFPFPPRFRSLEIREAVRIRVLALLSGDQRVEAVRDLEPVLQAVIVGVGVERTRTRGLLAQIVQAISVGIQRLLARDKRVEAVRNLEAVSQTI